MNRDPAKKRHADNRVPRLAGRAVKRPDSAYWWIVGTVRGQRIRESTGTDSAAQAEEARAVREAAAFREAIHGAPRGSTTFAAACLSYLSASGPHSDATKARVHRLLKFFGPAAACAAVDQAALDRAAAKFLRPNPASATRLREITTPARSILSHASRRGWCDTPAFEVGAASPSRTEWLTPAEVDRLIDAATPHIRPLLTFLTATGARMGEALSLDWADVDLAHRRALLRDTKSGADRAVDLCPRAVSVLCQSTGRVFRTNAGEPYAERVASGGQIKTAWAAAVRRAGITKPITPHGLRHTWASWHYAEHRDLLLLRYVGCWASVTLVERYAHLVPSSLAAEIVDWRAASDTFLTRPDAAGSGMGGKPLI